MTNVQATPEVAHDVPPPAGIVADALAALAPFGVTTACEAGQLLPMWRRYSEMSAGDRTAVFRCYRPAGGTSPLAAELVSAAAAGQPALTRIARANMLRAISRMSYAADRAALPAPASVRFDAKRHAVVLEFDAVGQAEAWAAELAAGDPDRDAMATPDGRQWRYFNAHAEWRGFHLSLVALVPAGAAQTSAVPA